MLVRGAGVGGGGGDHLGGVVKLLRRTLPQHGLLGAMTERLVEKR